MEWKLPLFKIHADEADVAAVAAVIRRGSFWADGPEIKEFEERLAAYHGKGHAITFNSGTSALHALLVACDLHGGEVIVPSFTFVATANTIVLAGGRPVFAEIEPATMALDATDVARKIGPKTKAVLFIHYAGCPARDTEKLQALCKKHSLLMLEDAAESMGANINEKKVGTFGDAAMISFCQNKIISTGEGAVIVTDSATIAGRLRLIRSHGRVEAKESYFESVADNDYIDVGYNLRMPTMNAALGLSQLEKVEWLIGKRQENAGMLREGLRSLPIGFLTPPDGYENVYQIFTIILQDAATRDKLQTHLAAKGIMTKVYFNPVHLKTYYRRAYGCAPGDLPTTERLAGQVLTLPLYVDMTTEERTFLLNAVREYFKGRQGRR